MTTWVFGYGSLLWNPGFAPAEALRATLTGYRRSFCLRSEVHRGTPEAPGLVLGLEPEPAQRCEGMAFCLPEDGHDAALRDLRARELVTDAYLERSLPLSLADGRQISALCYVMDPAHRQYAALPLEEQAQIIAQAHGGRGPNRDYLWNTYAHLQQLGINDAEMAWLSARVRGLDQ